LPRLRPAGHFDPAELLRVNLIRINATASLRKGFVSAHSLLQKNLNGTKFDLVFLFAQSRFRFRAKAAWGRWLVCRCVGLRPLIQPDVSEVI
jgi:hypothetical protein